MYVPKSLIDEGNRLLQNDESALLEQLGGQLFQSEQQESGHPLTGRFSSQELRQKAEFFLASKKELLHRAICPDWKERKREDYTDATDILALLIPTISQALQLGDAYLSLAMMTAVIILKRGINKFCE